MLIAYMGILSSAGSRLRSEPENADIQSQLQHTQREIILIGPSSFNVEGII